jgi:hypothetical protein
MKHTVRLKGVIVGHSELEHIEPGTGRAWGSFRPGLGYDLVQPVFALFAEAAPRNGTRDNAKLKRYYAARDALGLSLEDAAGQPIRTTTIHIADYDDASSDAPELEVLISDDGYWKRRLESSARAN